ncbi:DUF5591 domain-containing protein [bacterium]|nr:DUF5591 domain-containing protein [bacterium]
MDASEVRYRLIAALLQADGPSTLARTADECALTQAAARAGLDGLVQEGVVVRGDLLAGKRGPHYCWAERWAGQAERRDAKAQHDLREIVGPNDGPLAIDGKAVRDFNRFVIDAYQPPLGKRFLVILQCSVRRPFSSSPSHGSMKRAIEVATGHHPKKDAERCPVHVVVLASAIGPVPYDLEDVHPATVRGGGVKHFSPERYDAVRPILAERTAAYIDAHSGRYERIATFTEGRYGEVMADARARGGRDFPILPVRDGRVVVRMGTSVPRKYWEKYWIQLCLEIMGWLPPEEQARAKARLRKLEVLWR